MRIDAHPLVVAAALGLLGPAALADDETGPGRDGPLSGVWSRAASAEVADTAGARLELIPVEDRLLVDAGDDGAATWTLLDDGRAQLRVDGPEHRLERTLAVEADRLVVSTRLCQNGTCVEFDEQYRREV